MISSQKLKKYKKDYLVFDFLKIAAFALVAVSTIASSPIFIVCAWLAYETSLLVYCTSLFQVNDKSASRMTLLALIQFIGFIVFFSVPMPALVTVIGAGALYFIFELFKHIPANNKPFLDYLSQFGAVVLATAVFLSALLPATLGAMIAIYVTLSVGLVFSLVVNFYECCTAVGSSEVEYQPIRTEFPEHDWTPEKMSTATELTVQNAGTGCCGEKSDDAPTEGDSLSVIPAKAIISNNL